MVFPLDENLDPTFEELYNELYLFDETDPDGEGYFIKSTKKCFPSILSEVDAYMILIRVLAWAVARSYQQPIILRYIYDPDLVLNVLLPKLADTLDFKLPIRYPEEDVRMIIKYLQKIRRTRGTYNSIKKLIRILNVSRREILEMSWKEYASADVVEGDTGILFIQYNNLDDLDFILHMLQYVMPAGYMYRVESGMDTQYITGNVYRNRIELSKQHEFQTIDTDMTFFDTMYVHYKISIAKNEKMGNVSGDSVADETVIDDTVAEDF